MEYCRQKDLQSKIGSIIQDAKKFIVIVSPYISLDSTYTALLQMSISKNIPVTFFYREQENFKDINLFEHLSGVNLYECPGLHAKIYMNEVDFLITSRNLYMKKGEESFDIGVFSNINENGEIYSKLNDDLELFARTSRNNYQSDARNNNFQSNTRNNDFQSDTFIGRNSRKRHRKPKYEGFCIRCGKPIPFNPDMPYCSSCFSVWSRFEDMTYPENVCHKCGNEEEDISMAKPLCFPCWKDMVSVSF
jgi:RNA polymerase-binding transcription factor DksA